jgi:hypothetical protein
MPISTRATLLPLLDIQTGLEIPDCPTTLLEIFRLPRAEAVRILQALQVPVPAADGRGRRVRVTDLRAAVEKQFTLAR